MTPPPNARPGTVYLVGAGPGDPALITERGKALLARADVILYDALAHPALLRHAKASAVLVSVGKRAGRVSERQDAIHARMATEARAGRSVVRLKGGDPYLFGRGSEEAEFLARSGIPFEVVPGVPSTLAVAAYAGVPLTHRDLASSVAYVTATESPEKDASAHDWAKLATATQTLVIFMGLRKLPELMALLMAHGRDPKTPAAVVQSASLAAQRCVTGTVEDIAARAHAAGLGMPALTVVGKVVALRDTLRWFDMKPLFSKRVVVTRPAHQAADLAAALRAEGAEPIHVPIIQIVPPADPGPLRAACANLDTYSWVVFTSANGAARVFDELAGTGRDARAFGQAKVMAIGPATARELARYGLRVDAMPPAFIGESVLEALRERGDVAGSRVLIPRAAVARDVVPDGLRASGATVDVVAAYETVGASAEAAAALRALLTTGGADAITFTSSSTVTETVRALGADASRFLAPLKVASIGPVTTRTAEAQGIRVDCTAGEHTHEGLVHALSRAYETR